MMDDRLRGLSKRLLPASIYRKLVQYTRNPPIGRIDFGDLRQLEPISDVWGLDRGLPVDRYYIEQFLSDSSAKIEGHVLEIGGNAYTLKFGGNKVTESDILHVSTESTEATIIADLVEADHIPSDRFDCIICTQTLHFIYEIEAAIDTLHRILKPGGVLLATIPGISQISRYDMDRWGDYWRMTDATAKRLFSDAFTPQKIEVTAYGNVLAAVAFLHGIAVEELATEELNHLDPDYQVLITVCAAKAET
jgi:SAM-dependent methyltransferase